METGQKLCLNCGLCCNGALHPRVPLEVDEVWRFAKLLSDEIFELQGEPQLKLPCKAWKNSKCSIYNERPQRCRAYQCKLLERVLNNEIPLAEAEAIVQQAKSLTDPLKKEKFFEKLFK